MKLIRRNFTLAGLLLPLAITTSTNAIENLKIAVRCPDVVLSWPSASNESYIVQCRATLDTNSPWVTLTNSLPAAEATNVTSFVHSNQVDCPSGLVFGMMSGSGEPSGTEATTAFATTLSVEERMLLKAEREKARLDGLYARCEREGRQPFAWELENRPPYPWEALLQPNESTAGGSNGPEPPGGGGGGGGGGSGGSSSTNYAFYRVVRLGPNLFGLTNGMTLSGMVSFPIELGSTYTNELQGFTLYADGLPVPCFEVQSNAVGPWIAKWNTAFLRNGSYSLDLTASFTVEDYAVHVPVEGSTRTVNIDNGIVFPYPNLGLFGSHIWFYFETKAQVVDYQIDVFVVTNTYIGSFQFHITDGFDSFLWDPVSDGFTNESFRCAFAATASGGGGTSRNTNVWYSREDTFDDGMKMVVAWSPPTASASDAQKAEQMVISGVPGGSRGRRLHVQPRQRSKFTG